jgi:hypothetical protein
MLDVGQRLIGAVPVLSLTLKASRLSACRLAHYAINAACLIDGGHGVSGDEDIPTKDVTTSDVRVDRHFGWRRIGKLIRRTKS